MGVGAGLYMCDVVKKFTFAISSPDEFLLFQHDIIVDSKLPGDLVQAPGTGSLTPVSWDSRKFRETWNP